MYPFGLLVTTIFLTSLSSFGSALQQIQNHRSCPFAALVKTRTKSPDMCQGVQAQETIRNPQDALQIDSATETTKHNMRATYSSSRQQRTWLDRIDTLYASALAIKCPFFRRRATDIVDALHRVVVCAILHQDIVIPSLRCSGEKCIKEFGLSLDELMDVIRQDWKETTSCGYYVTGKLTEQIYRDDCLFDGPDPDMPVRGLRKYLNAASQLFDKRHTRSKLLSLTIQDDKIEARWCFHGTMRLPWRPEIPEMTGTTTYHVDPSGLIYKHIETWDVSVLQVFVRTFWPSLSAFARSKD